MPTGVRPEIRHLAISIDRLRPHPRNARCHDDEALQESLRHHGQYRPIVISRDDVILAGNGTYAAAMALGWTEIAATSVDLDSSDDAATRILLVDNRANDLARTDEGLLASLLSDLPDLSGTLYSQEDLGDLLARVAGDEAPLFGPAGIEEQGRLDQKAAVTCPECGHEFHPS